MAAAESQAGKVEHTAKSVSCGRPAYHFTAPRGWMNDPCAPGYDPATKTFHLMYQWNPASTEWGDICWGSATSKDMVHWTHNPTYRPVLVADAPYDCKAVFTGCMLPNSTPQASTSASSSSFSNGHTTSSLTVAYTSISHLPIHYTEQHPRGCEGVALASSTDGGKTWQKSPNNPVVVGEPAQFDATGFRDPFVAPWPAMDDFLGRRPAGETWYALLSGGIRDKGPCLFLYEVDPNNPEKWTYMCQLLGEFPINHTFSRKWAGDLGANWECGNYLTLKADAPTATTHRTNGPAASSSSTNGAPKVHERLFIIFGSEGCHERDHVRDYCAEHPKVPRRVPRCTNWISGTIGPSSADPAQPDIRPIATGDLDPGDPYAATTFQHPDGRTIMWAWLVEEDVTPAQNKLKGYTGCLSIPRELFLYEHSGVLGTFGGPTPLEEIPSFELARDEDGSYTVGTLGSRPLHELKELRTKTLYSSTERKTLSSAPGVSQAQTVLHDAPLAYEIEATFTLTENCEQVGIIFSHTANMEVYAAAVYLPQEEIIKTERERSNLDPYVTNVDEEGPFTLLQFQGDPEASPEEEEATAIRPMTNGHAQNEHSSSRARIVEPLRLRIFRDHDIVEVFANDRFAMATRVYSPLEANDISIFVRSSSSSTTSGLQEGATTGALLESMTVWEMGDIGLQHLS